MTAYFNPRTKAWESKEEMERRPMDHAGETVLGSEARLPSVFNGPYFSEEAIRARRRPVLERFFQSLVEEGKKIAEKEGLTPSPNTASRTS